MTEQRNATWPNNRTWYDKSTQRNITMQGNGIWQGKATRYDKAKQRNAIWQSKATQWQSIAKQYDKGMQRDIISARYDRRTQRDMTKHRDEIWQTTRYSKKSNPMQYETARHNKTSACYSLCNLVTTSFSSLQLTVGCAKLLMIQFCSLSRSDVHVLRHQNECKCEDAAWFFSWTILRKSKSIHIIVLNSWRTYKC